jgi:hypothetical protein
MNRWSWIFGLVLLTLPTFGVAQNTETINVHISEFIPNPVGTDSELEFIELHNYSDQEVDISGWSIDTGGSATFSFDSGATISVREFLAFFSKDKNISLTNSGDHIRLLRADGTVQDDIVYSTSKEGYSYIRNEEGAYEQTDTPTPNAENIVLATPTPSPSVTPTPAPTPSPTPSASPTLAPTPVLPTYSDEVRINEFLPNPIGSDSTLEFIELYNASGGAIDVSGWKIGNGSSSFIIPDGNSIAAAGYLVFMSAETGSLLGNTGDRRVQLIDPDGIIRKEVSYSGSTEGYSYNRTDSGDFQKSSTATPGAANSITLPAPTPTSSPLEEDAKESITYDFSTKIFINEFLPNPKGSDTELEFIELKNMDTKKIRLVGWTLDDGDKGSSPYHFSDTDTISPDGIIVLFRSKTKIALNNDTDSVRLVDPKGVVISAVTYTPKVQEGDSYARNVGNVFVWTSAPTPGKENTIVVQEEGEGKEDNPFSKKASVPRTARTDSSSSARTLAPKVLSATTSFLPWPDLPETLSVRTVIDSSNRRFSGRQQVFIFFGGFVACAQLVSGVLSKERIWRGQ